MKKGIDHIGIAVVFFCHDGKGNVLLSKRLQTCRDEHGTWDPGGGAVEYGDTIEKTLEKEIKEEYCTDIIDYEFLGYRDVLRENNHWLALDFKVLIDPNKVKNGEPHKLEKVEWFQLNNLPEPTHSQFPKFLELYKNKL